MCQIDLTSIQGQSTNGVTASGITLTGTAASSCKTLKLNIIGCNFDPIPHSSLAIPVTAGNWQYSLAGDCVCNSVVKVEAFCCDAAGNPVPGCSPVAVDMPIVCSPVNPAVECCPQVTITFPNISDCNANDERQVTVNVAFNVAPSQVSCLPYKFLLNFGDGNFSGIQTVNTVGPHTLSLNHNYNAGLSYTPTLEYILPDGLLCPMGTAAVDVLSCAPPNCCPVITDIAVAVGDCNGDCERPVTLTTTFAHPVPGCGPAFLQWRISDQNNIIYGPSFDTSDPSPRIDHFLLSSLNSPYEANLFISYPDGCGEVVQPLEIVIPGCESAPPCPVVNNFTYSIGNCKKEKNGNCCRQVSFTYDINVKMGCGKGPKPKIKIDFGDGSFEEQEFSSGGQMQMTVTNNYCSGGEDYVATLETLYPAACFDKTLTVSVPVCVPEDCETIIEPPSDGFCPCCIPLLILVTSYYCLWAMGLYQGNLVVFTVNLGSIWGYSSAIFMFLLWLLITFCYRIVPSCMKCWQCRFYRCMFWALIISLFVIVVVVIIRYYYTGDPKVFWDGLSALLLAIASAMLFYALMQTEPCKTFYSTGKCPK